MCARMTTFCHQYGLTGSRSAFTLHLVHLTVLRYNHHKLLSARSDGKQEYPSADGQKKAWTQVRYPQAYNGPILPYFTYQQKLVGKNGKTWLQQYQLLTLMSVKFFVRTRRVLMSHSIPPKLFQNHFYVSIEKISDHNYFIIRKIAMLCQRVFSLSIYLFNLCTPLS